MSANEFLPIPSSDSVSPHSIPLSLAFVSDDTRTQSASRTAAAAHASFLCHRLQGLRQGVG